MSVPVYLISPLGKLVLKGSIIPRCGDFVTVTLDENKVERLQVDDCHFVYDTNDNHEMILQEIHIIVN